MAKKRAGAKSESKRRYVLLPPRGLTPHTPGASRAVGGVLRGMAQAMMAGGAQAFVAEEAPRVRMKVVDSIREDGAKLVEITPDAVQQLRAAQPGLRIVPEVFYRTALFRPTVDTTVKASATASAAKAATAG